MSLFNIPPSLECVLGKYLSLLKIPMSEEQIGEELEKHPDTPSLLAVSDVLSNFKISNTAFSIDLKDIPEMPVPFLALMTTGGGATVIVTKVDPEYLTINTGRQVKRILFADFQKDFSGIVLFAEPEKEFSKSKIVFSKIAQLKIPMLVTGFIMLTAYCLTNFTTFFDHLSWQAGITGLLKLGGLAVSVLLLIQSVDKNNPLVQTLCQNGGEKDCNAILTSNAAMVFNGLSWSEVGFFYFAGTLLMVLTNSNLSLAWHTAGILNLLSLPYTVYSINYQSRAKKWCILCCTIQALLWLEFIPLLIINLQKPYAPSEWSGLGITNILTCLVSPILLWMTLKPLFLRLQQIEPLKYQVRNFKYSAELFNKILADQPKFIQPDMQWSMVLGNKEAATTITMVTSPYCPPCAKMHTLLGELMSQNNDLQARIIFTADDDNEDPKTHVARHLMAISARGDEEQTLQAMHDWYAQEQKDYKSWAKDHPVDIREEDFYKIGLQKAWCEMAEIHATPTMMINGHVLPSLYYLPDLKYMLQ